MFINENSDLQSIFKNKTGKEAIYDNFYTKDYVQWLEKAARHFHNENKHAKKESINILNLLKEED